MKIAIIGAGISGMASAAVLAQAGHNVTVFEKNDQIVAEHILKKYGTVS